MMPSRRQFVATLCAGTVLVAGCNSRSGDEDERTPEPELPEETPTPTPEDGDDTPDDETAGTDSIVDIRDHGAAIDGVTDDTEAIQRALQSADDGDTLYFPPGRTLVSMEGDQWNAAIALSSHEIPDNLTLRGAGTDSVIQLADDQHEIHSVIRLVGNESFDDLTIANLHIDGNRSAQTGRGGHGVLLYNEGGAVTPADVTLTNLWVAGSSQSGITVYRGGVLVNNCTVRHCNTHGINIGNGAGWDEGLPRVVISNCFCAQNGKSGPAATYGVNCSGGNVLVEDSVMANNGQGTKTTEDCINVTYRRVRLRNNDHYGYIRAGEPTENRTKVYFDDVVAELNGRGGFRLARDTDYRVPTQIVAVGNHDHNIFITQDARVDAERIWAIKSQTSYGLEYNSSSSGHIHEYFYYDNAEGPMYGNDEVTIEVRDRRNGTRLATVPRSFDVGARIRDERNTRAEAT